MHKSVGIVKYARGTVWKYLSPTDDKVPGIQAGDRPVVIVSEDTYNYLSDVVNVITLTHNCTRGDTPISLIVNGEGDLSNIQINQLKPVRKEWLGEYMGKLDDRTLEELRRKLINHLGLGDPGVYFNTQESYSRTTLVPKNHTLHVVRTLHKDTHEKKDDTTILGNNNIQLDIPTMHEECTNKMEESHNKEEETNTSKTPDDNSSDSVVNPFTIAKMINKIPTDNPSVETKQHVKEPVKESRVVRVDLEGKIIPKEKETQTSTQKPADVTPIDKLSRKQMVKKGTLTKEFAIQLLADKAKMTLRELADKYGYSTPQSVASTANALKKRYKL